MSKSFVNISLAIKESLRIDNETQFMNYQMNNSTKNQIYPKHKSQCISLDWLYNAIVSMSLKLMLLLPYDMRNELTCKTINISRRSIITVHYWGLEFWIWVTLNLWMAYSNRQIKHSVKSVQIRTRNNSVFGRISHSETHWKLGVEILIDKFSSWNYKKTPGITNISTTM